MPKSQKIVPVNNYHLKVYICMHTYKDTDAKGKAKSFNRPFSRDVTSLPCAH